MREFTQGRAKEEEAADKDGGGRDGKGSLQNACSELCFTQVDLADVLLSSTGGKFQVGLFLRNIYKGQSL